ncbi:MULTISPECIES: cell wall metabolism sensor histidine kinase WalK [unclassified Kaistella]|uniref:sensor histidine kinase n=1 Tax=unclassified Kaistella TaxID=2762626 RepID=UPI00273234EF|nr:MULTISPECIES: ATP-binding protein [unclassified Kaistella]MDP2453438.1 ATP-binding protein [Kaistella sp. SH11-4b]MDP2456495.1 ATP-binding protein [Kaistella sp. SH40-3]MDP2459251.1 ATP-binding protein [Kaistella sp. SH19-2b]
MKFYRLTFLASLFLTAVMLLLIYLFDEVKHYFSDSDLRFFMTMLISSVALLIINYLVVDFLFNYYGKRQIKKISTILPEEIRDEETDLNFKELSQRFSDLNLKNTTEIDTMKEMETYRKEYIGNISHEMKTPLFTIQGYVDTLLEGGVENLAIRDKYLERIDKSVERLLNIVNDLDMMNQFESGMITLTKSRFDLNHLIRELIDILDLEAQKKNTKIVLQTTSTQIFVQADKQKISQVLLNLISNAIYYSNRESATVTVKTKIQNQKVLVEVEDNGMGIKPEMLPRIFERFYRIESSRNRNDGGSGLGLAIVKHILEAHHENITVESTYLEGTKFSFFLQKSI